MRPEIEYSVSYTTRTPRGEEVDGRDYHFVSTTEFEKMIADNAFIEHALVHGKYYGTSRAFIKEKINCGKLVVLDIDIQGAYQIKNCGIDYCALFILPPSRNIWKERLVARGTETSEQVDIRLTTAEVELKAIKDFEYIVINNDVQKASADVMAIIRSEENKTNRYIDALSTFGG